MLIIIIIDSNCKRLDEAIEKINDNNNGFL